MPTPKDDDQDLLSRAEASSLDDLNHELREQQDRLLELKRQQDEIERRKRELEELNKKRNELSTGKKTGPRHHRAGESRIRHTP